MKIPLLLHGILLIVTLCSCSGKSKITLGESKQDDNVAALKAQVDDYEKVTTKIFAKIIERMNNQGDRIDRIEKAICEACGNTSPSDNQCGVASSPL